MIGTDRPFDKIASLPHLNRTFAFLCNVVSQASTVCIFLIILIFEVPTRTAHRVLPITLNGFSSRKFQTLLRFSRRKAVQVVKDTGVKSITATPCFSGTNYCSNIVYIAVIKHSDQEQLKGGKYLLGLTFYATIPHFPH